ncbi:hypothetical protein RRG08_014073 [Elysia crispata]|uniref:Uncharacterized protein n=1 Tax=Elysia crispata TaxID=231223 RepID=A0AAE1A0P1_9GAST|nr:hypothetical protein RRG08_014073 [Elysia crispata]
MLCSVLKGFAEDFGLDPAVFQAPSTQRDHLTRPKDVTLGMNLVDDVTAGIPDWSVPVRVPLARQMSAYRTRVRMRTQANLPQMWTTEYNVQPACTLCFVSVHLYERVHTVLNTVPAPAYLMPQASLHTRMRDCIELALPESKGFHTE